MSIYQDQIMDHYRNPRNFGCKACKPNGSSTMHNPSCGDKIIVHADIEGDIIRNICFEGFGCALSTASASLLTEHVKGQKIAEVEKMDANQVLKLLSIEITPARMKCALLPLEAIQEAVKNSRT